MSADKLLVLRPSIRLFIEDLPRRASATVPYLAIVTVMYVLINVESSWSVAWQFPALVIGAIGIGVLVATPFWAVFFVRGGLLVSQDSITYVGFFGKKKWSRARFARVVRVTLTGYLRGWFGYKAPCYFFLSPNGDRLLVIPANLWPQVAIHTFCAELSVPLEGSFDDMIGARDISRHFPAAGA